jgi:hypothetical protein
MCTYFKIDNYPTDACRKRKSVQEGGNNGNDERNLLPVQAPRPRQSRLRFLQTYNGVLESEESHCYSRPGYDQRL